MVALGCAVVFNVPSAAVTVAEELRGSVDGPLSVAEQRSSREKEDRKEANANRGEPALIQPSPTLSTALPAPTPLTDEHDFARMRMKARTYVGTDGSQLSQLGRRRELLDGLVAPRNCCSAAFREHDNDRHAQESA
eukprot:Skav222420  [mRNA]  locus=scaffold2890:120185:122109:+ [translate_table: standard]